MGIVFADGEYEGCIMIEVHKNLHNKGVYIEKLSKTDVSEFLINALLIKNTSSISLKVQLKEEFIVEEGVMEKCPYMKVRG